MSCFIIPNDVLKRLSADPEFSNALRQSLRHTAEISSKIREVRDQNAALTLGWIALPKPVKSKTPGKPHISPASQVFNCHGGTTLPGTLESNPGASTDGTVKRAYDEERAVAKFYWDVFKRDSIDNHKMMLISSVHYGHDFTNAFWNGAQMTYGDGDGKLFLDFTLGDDVVGHELTHGVTQHSLGLVYSGEAGGLNESMSDVFGSMFRQWEKNQSVSAADWLIGSDIMGPLARKKGYSCLRNMVNPKDPHALGSQPDHYYPGIGNLDPHASSGVPNRAFAMAAIKIGGKSWDKAGKIWYAALTGSGPVPNMTMSQFANKTRSLASSMFSGDPAILSAVDDAWKAVGL